MDISGLAILPIGIMAGIIMVVIVLKFSNRDHRMTTEYDERQQKIRGKAYQYAFYTLVVCEVVHMAVDMGKIELPVEGAVIHFSNIIIAGLVLAGYCVWHDVYWGLNNDRRRYAISFIALAALNAIPVVGAVKNDSLIVDGRLSTPFINLMVLVMMAVLAVMLIIKEVIEKKIEESEED